MKKILFFAASVILFGSCTKSPEQKVNALIKEYLEKTLYHPDTYAPTNTELDSAFTPYDDPVFYEKTLKLAKLGVLIEECNDDASSAKRGLALTVLITRKIKQNMMKLFKKRRRLLLNVRN